MRFFMVCKRIIGLFACALLMLFNVISANVPFGQMLEHPGLEELYGNIKNDKKYLSPLHGLVWSKSDLIEKYYRFGPQEKVVEERGGHTSEVFVSGDTTIEFVWQLFHGVPLSTGRSFTASRANPLAVAYYLEAEDIGKILNAVEQGEEDLVERVSALASAAIERFRSRTQRGVDQLRDDLRADITRVYGEIKGKKAIGEVPRRAERQRVYDLFKQSGKYPNVNTPAWWELFFNSFYMKIPEAPTPLSPEGLDSFVVRPNEDLFKTQLDSFNAPTDYHIKFVEWKTKIKSWKEAKDKILKKNLPANEKCLKFATLLVEALKESGDLPGGAVKYPSHTPHFILLAFLYEKVERVADYNAYFAQFAPTIRIGAPEEVIPEQAMIDQYPIRVRECFWARRPNYLPPRVDNLAGMTRPTPTAEGTIFSDCVEASLLEFFALVAARFGLYSNAEGFVVGRLAEIRDALAAVAGGNLVADSNEIGLLQAVFRSINEQQGNINHRTPRQLWVNTISRLGDRGVTYHNHQDHEIVALPSNYVKLFNYFFGFKFTSIEQLFGHLGIAYQRAETTNETKSPTVDGLADVTNDNVTGNTTNIYCTWKFDESRAFGILVQFGSGHGELTVKASGDGIGVLQDHLKILCSMPDKFTDAFSYLHANILAFADDLNILQETLNNWAFDVPPQFNQAKLVNGRIAAHFRFATLSFDVERTGWLIKFLSKNNKLLLTDATVKQILLANSNRLVGLLDNFKTGAMNFDQISAIAFAAGASVILENRESFTPIVRDVKTLAREFLATELLDLVKGGASSLVGLCDRLEPLSR